MIEVHRSPDRDGVVVAEGGVAAAPTTVWPAPPLAHEEEMELPAALDIEGLHAELAGLRDFRGIQVRGEKLFTTWRAKPSEGAMTLVRARAKAHQMRPGARDALGRA